MRYTVLALALIGCQADPLASEAYEETNPHRWCGTHEPSEGAKLTTEVEVARIPRADAPRGGTVAVHVHVIARGQTLADGAVPDATLATQVAILDRAFADAGWHFTLASVDRVVRPDWHLLRHGSAEERAVKAQLRVGGPRDLNIYVADPGNGVTGYATYPTDYKSAPHADGVVIHHGTLPGGGEAPYDHGDQLVHQVGHWMGLYHTYQPACSSDRGDFVSDTPASSMPAFGCPVGRDTCGQDGDDPVRNYMDSTDDSCMNAFTPGQAERLQIQFDAFRRF